MSELQDANLNELLSEIGQEQSTNADLLTENVQAEIKTKCKSFSIESILSNPERRSSHYPTNEITAANYENPITVTDKNNQSVLTFSALYKNQGFPATDSSCSESNEVEFVQEHPLPKGTARPLSNTEALYRKYTENAGNVVLSFCFLI